MDNPARDLLADAVKMHKMTPHCIQPTPEEAKKPFWAVQTLISIGPLSAPKQLKKKRRRPRKTLGTVIPVSNTDPMIHLITENDIEYFPLHISGLEDVDPDDLSDENIAKAKKAVEGFLLEPEAERNIKFMVIRLVAARILRARLSIPTQKTHSQAPMSEMNAVRSPVELEDETQPIRSTPSLP